MFEGGEGRGAASAVLDFCSASAAQQILVGMQPSKDRKTDRAQRGQTREQKFSRVKFSEDGKILIEEDEDEDQQPQGKQGNMPNPAVVIAAAVGDAAMSACMWLRC